MASSEAEHRGPCPGIGFSPETAEAKMWRKRRTPNFRKQFEKDEATLRMASSGTLGGDLSVTLPADASGIRGVLAIINLAQQNASHTFMIPTFILWTWLLGLLSIGVVGGAAYLGREWQMRSWGWDPVLQRSIFTPTLGWNVETALLASAIGLVLFALCGGALIRAFLRLSAGSKRTAARGALPAVAPRVVKTLGRPDGSQLHVELYGPEEGTPIVMTHGWGFHGAEWNYIKASLSERFRLIIWDEPGLGKSTRPANRDYSIENLARDLEAVLGLAGNKPAVLLGHSIGGMITLTFCRLSPEALGTRVLGLVLTHTTPTNPVRTTSGAGFLTAIETPILKPLMYLTIALSPLVWLMNWLSYLNGSAHLSTKHGSFCGTESADQVEFATVFQTKARPSVLARGMLGMMRYDARQTLSGINVPTLVVAGDKDTTTKPSASEEIHARIPHARLLTLSPAKHLGLIEHYVRYEAAVREFVYAACAQNGNSPI